MSDPVIKWKWVAPVVVSVSRFLKRIEQRDVTLEMWEELAHEATVMTGDGGHFEDCDALFASTAESSSQDNVFDDLVLDLSRYDSCVFHD